MKTTEKYFKLQDELKTLRLEGCNVDNAISLLEDIIKELDVPEKQD